MKKIYLVLSIFIITCVSLLFLFADSHKQSQKQVISPKKSHWFVLNRKSGTENLYFGKAEDVNNSKLVRTFQVKTGASWSPTPLPELVGRKYWKIIKKESSKENPETAPYFLTLDIPTTEHWPYGPTPYEECKDLFTGDPIQCDWILPGYFGLHGVGGNLYKLSKEDYGSSGCIRHKDEDITYLYNLLNPEKEEIRYYIKDI